MRTKKKDRRSSIRTRPLDVESTSVLFRRSLKEFSYALQINATDISLLKKYRQLILQGTTGFAEIYYNYLFDNPDIADVLYSFERNGGNISEIIKSELQCMFDSLFSFADKSILDGSFFESGVLQIKNGIKPLWVVGAYRLFADYLEHLAGAFTIPEEDNSALKSTLNKVIIRDMAYLLESYRYHSLKNLNDELIRITRQQHISEDLLAGLPHMFWSVDVDGNAVIYANPSMHALYNDDLAAPIPCLENTNKDDQQLLLNAWQGAIDGNPTLADVRISFDDADERWHRLSIYPSVNKRGRVILVYCMLEDIDLIINERRQLEKLTTTDRLTELPNRAMWNDHLNMALAASRRVPGSQVAIISLDINQFKMYNDTLGRHVGDLLLKEIADRLNSVVRESDSLARLGGDQFGILLQPVSDARKAADRVATQVLDCFDMPFSFGDKQLCVSLSLGVACFPDNGTNSETLLTNAESAMYRAKRNGVPYQFFDPCTDVSPVEQLRYSGQIRGALDNNEFELHYQPVVDISTSGITGAEALLRWQHPTEGTVPPQRIIPVAEQLGMISPITDWVLVTALRQCREWAFQQNGIPVSVNVSARSFQSPRLFDKVKHALDEAGVDGDSLEIEITEATLMLDLERASDLLRKLSDIGVRIAIDDFGTGYSSLSYLKKLPIHTLKIDQSFIMDVAFDHQDVAIVRSIIDLAHNLEYRVIAEGVENSMAWNMLSELGCDAAQGFHICHPLPEDHFSSWLSNASWNA